MARRTIPLLVLACGLPLVPRGSGQTVILKDVDSGLTSPQGNYRWLDVGDQAYGAPYRTTYNYTQAQVSVSFEPSPQPVRGILEARNLKPNFAYQLKLVGTAGSPSNQKIGRAGRYWQEEWNGTAWANGWNLNDQMVSLELADLYVGITNSIERCEAAPPASGWRSVFTFVSGTPNTNWVSTIGPDSIRAFYRLASQVGP